MTEVLERPAAPSVDDDPRLARHTAAWAALSGLLAAAAALATGELISGFSKRVPSLLVGIFDVMVDYSPTGVVSWSRETFGTDQKTVTITGITIVTLVLGSLFGIAARRDLRIGFAGFVGFGLVGGWAIARSPLSSTGLSWFTAFIVIAVGLGVLVSLLRLLPFAPSAVEFPERLTSTADRRWFLGTAGGATFFALFGTGLGRALRRNQSGGTLTATQEAQLATADPVFTQVAGASNFDDVEGISSLITPTANNGFYRIDSAFAPLVVDVEDWTLTIKGMVDNEVVLTFDDLLAMDQITETITISCVSNEVGGPYVGNAVWTGVPLPALLDLAGVQEGATQIVGRSLDDWTGGFPTEVAFDGRPAMLAIAMNGEPLQSRHGFPARLIIPGLYGYVSATKWIKEIELTTWDDFDGFWITRGWAKEGPIKTQSRIDVPSRGQTVPAGPTPIAGVAWAPIRGIDKVEVQVDDGPWTEATLSDELTDNAWRQWVVEYDATPGEHVARVRATDGDGETQTPERSRVDPDGATGHHTISFEVA